MTLTQGLGRDGKVKCDGYAPPKTQTLAREHLAAQVYAEPRTGLLLAASPAGLVAEAFDGGPATVLFRHSVLAPSRTLPRRLQHRPRSGIATFWNRHVLPFGNAIPAVRHAAMAVGAAHQASLQRHVGALDPQVMERMDHLSIFEYNQAIRRLLPHMSAGSIRGCASESVRHLRAGAQLLLPIVGQGTGPASTVNVGCTDALSEISTLFSRLGVEAALYAQDQIVPEFRSRGTCFAGWTENQWQTTFPTLADASDALWELDEELSTYNSRAFVIAKTLPGDSPLDRASALHRIIGPTYIPAIRFLVKRFRHWRARFAKTAAEAEQRGVQPSERPQITMLILRQRVWETMLDETPGGDPLLADSILDCAGELIHHLSSKNRTFQIESRVLSSASFAWCYSGQERHYRRALNILRSAHVCEGVWESGKLADMMEAGYAQSQAYSTNTEPSAHFMATGLQL
ncbi:unnamed protein product [Clonostachys rhizophaga]|uniref:Uncharacterized protein n=1 Tax=Clonostachys rhizophaga TaxID=160324 RepID=A0A9N9YNB3_9HYPO|nr:unnamed protein product [Clonostachys rhizophaga]